MNQIYLKWCTGEMTIDLIGFFPAKAKDVKKLLEIIRMDIQGEDHIGRLLNHLNDRLPDLEGRAEKQMQRNVEQLKKAK
ncbi:MAG: hypothetical protein ACRC3H_24400 [Lachnospiraceae bacterium]